LVDISWSCFIFYNFCQFLSFHFFNLYLSDHIKTLSKHYTLYVKTIPLPKIIGAFNHGAPDSKRSKNLRFLKIFYVTPQLITFGKLNWRKIRMWVNDRDVSYFKIGTSCFGHLQQKNIKFNNMITYEEIGNCERLLCF
jgi:hypothetical protein